jgi:hypothetical protein
MASALLALASCGEKENKEPKGPTGRELSEITKTIDEEDRKAYVSLIDRYSAYLNGNIDVLRGMYPDEYWDAIGKTEDEFIDSAKASFEKDKATNSERYGDDWKVTYSIESEKNYMPFAEAIEEILNTEYGISEDRVEMVYSVFVDVTVKGSKGEFTDTLCFFPTEIDGSWYLVNETKGFN